MKKLALPNEEGSQTIILKKYKNCVYYGPIKNSKKHGFGYLHYFSGKFYEGLFEEDQKINGFEMDDSEIYVGKFHKNQRNGEGVLKTNDSLFAGTFTNGEFSLPKDDKLQSKINFHPNFLTKVENEVRLNKSGFKIDFSSVIFFVGGNVAIYKSNIGDLFIGELNEEFEKHGTGL